MLNQPTGIHHHVDVINQVGDIMIYYGSHSKIPTMIYDDSLIYIYIYVYLFVYFYYDTIWYYGYWSIVEPAVLTIKSKTKAPTDEPAQTGTERELEAWLSARSASELVRDWYLIYIS